MKRSRSAATWLLALIAVHVASGCREETRLFVTIDGDYAVPDEVDGLLVELRSREATFQTSHALTGVQARLEQTLAVAEGQQIRDEVEILVDARKGNRLVARGSAATRFELETSVPVHIHLEPAPADDGASDAGPVDAGLVDAGFIDAGLVDTGLVDAGPAPGGPDDGGTGDQG